MRVFKPRHLSVMHRVFERQQRAYLCVSVIAYTRLQSEPNLLPEQQMWSELPQLLGATPLDAAMPKTGSEFIVIGNACAPNGEPVRGLKVSAAIGSLGKTLHVFGERRWAGGRATEPMPFSTLPLSWSAAFGGKEHAINPEGVGLKPVDTKQGTFHPLPRIEYPKHPSMAPGKPIPPASFAPVPQLWPQRQRFAGTYDDAWLKQDFPGTPKDIDWRYFCVAPDDQWQAAAFRGDEALELIHMHADHPRIACKLPGIRPVVAVRSKDMQVNAAKFLEPALDTVWLFPNQLKAALIWHALMPVGDEFGDEIDLLSVGADWLGRPRTREHYLNATNARLDEENGALRALDDSDLIPERLHTPNDSLTRHEELLGSSGIALNHMQAKVRSEQAALNEKLTETFGAAAARKVAEETDAAIAAFNFPNPDKLINASSAELLAIAAQMPGSAQWQATLNQFQRDNLLKLKASAIAAGADTSVIDAALSPSRAAPKSPPKTSLLAHFESVLKDAAAAAGSNDALAPIALDPKMKALLAQADASMPSAQFAHLFGAPQALPEARTNAWREGAARAKAIGKSFAGKNLQGANFSGMDLSGVDFSGAQLDGVDFSGAQLQGANFTKASLAHARLDGATVDETSFVGANLGKARFDKTSIRQCDFSEATLDETRFEYADLSGSVFGAATLMQTRIFAARCHGINLAGASLIGCTLLGSDFTGADCGDVSFIECALNKANFSTAKLRKAVFVTCGANEVRFDGASGEKICFVHGTTLRAASFLQAQMPRASLRGMPLEGANFEGALLDGSDFGDARCANANFKHASLKQALMTKIDLSNAKLVFANLMQTILQHARLQGADLTGANLFAADLARITIDPATRLDHALMTKARTLPVRKVLPAPSSVAKAA